MNKRILPLSLSAVVFLLVGISCTNPFAPKLEKGEGQNFIVSDQTTIDGVFNNFRYAYVFKDTVVYGNLLSEDFSFVFRNYDQGIDVSWGREEDLRTTWGMFQATQYIDLVWNEVIQAVGDSTVQVVSRGFVLTLAFSTDDIIRVYGRANFRLERKPPKNIWQIVEWRDESNY